jgi:hypothetical protein
MNRSLQCNCGAVRGTVASLARATLPYVGLIHTCLESPGRTLDDEYGPVRMRVHTHSALGEPKPKALGLVPGMVRVFGGVLWARLSGAYRRNPFFDVASAAPIAAPRMLSPQERDELYSKVRAAALPLH